MNSSRRNDRPREPAPVAEAPNKTEEDAEKAKPSAARQTFLRWIKFNAVGAIGIVVQLAALAILRSWLKLNYLLATAIAVEIAVLHNFVWHERFTWADRPPSRLAHSLIRLAKFNATNGAVSIVGNLLLMRLLVGQFRFNYVLSNCAAIAICSLLNFLLGDRFVFES
ncbi:MAG TPA: GtrA family protein [Terriglobales bacterium]